MKAILWTTLRFYKNSVSMTKPPRHLPWGLFFADLSEAGSAHADISRFLHHPLAIDLELAVLENRLAAEFTVAAFDELLAD